MFAGLFLLVILVILAFTLGAWALVVLFWEHRIIRYIALPFAIGGTWMLVSYRPHDPNTSEAAKAWQGHYALHDCRSGSTLDSSWSGPMLIVDADRVCLIVDSMTDPAPIIGE